MKTTEHQFQQHNAGGNTFETSWSFQKCKKCGVCFTHKYHIESFEEALKREGIPKECSPNLNQL